MRSSRRARTPTSAGTRRCPRHTSAGTRWSSSSASRSTGTTAPSRRWAMRDGATLAGVVGLYRQGGGAAELGYWVAPDSRGRGFVTEAARAVVDWAFSDEGLELARIEWRAVVGNVGVGARRADAGLPVRGDAAPGAAQRFGRPRTTAGSPGCSRPTTASRSPGRSSKPEPPARSRLRWHDTLSRGGEERSHPSATRTNERS